MASRTIFFTIASVLVGALGPSSSLSGADDESDSSLCLLRRRALGVDSISDSAGLWGLEVSCE